MVDQIALIPFTTPSGAGLWTITNSAVLTETVKAGLFFNVAETTDDTQANHAILNIGFLANDGVQVDVLSAASCLRSVDVLTTTPTTQTVKATSVSADIVLMSASKGTGSTLGMQHDFDSFISGGVKLNAVTVTNQGKGTALLFAGVARAVTGAVGATTTLTAEGVATPNTFRPDLIILSGDTGAWPAAATFGNDARASLGFVIDDGSSSQVCFGGDWNNGLEPSDCDAEARTDRAGIAFQGDAGRAIHRLQITITSTGFNHQVVTGTDTFNFHYLAIQFTSKPPMFVGNFATPTSPTSAASFTTTGVTPQVVIGSSSLLAGVDSPESGATAGGWGRFMFSATQQRAFGVNSQAGLTAAVGTPTNANTQVGTHAVLTLSNTGSVAHQADFVSMDAAGFTLNFTTAATGRLTLLAIGVAAQTIAQSETEDITDGAVLRGFRSLVVGEVVQISDGLVGLTNEIHFNSDPAGTTFDAHAARGTTLQGGAVAGTTLD